MAPKARLNGQFGLPMPADTRAGWQLRDDPIAACGATMACSAAAGPLRRDARRVAWLMGALKCGRQTILTAGPRRPQSAKLGRVRCGDTVGRLARHAAQGACRRRAAAGSIAAMKKTTTLGLLVGLFAIGLAL